MATTEFIEIELVAENQSQKALTINEALSTLDSVIAGLVEVATTGGSTTLTEEQYNNLFIQVTGALTSNATIIVPDLPRMYAFINDTTGPYTLTIKNAATGGVILDQTNKNIIYSDGTTTEFLDAAPLTGLFDEAETHTFSAGQRGHIVTLTDASNIATDLDDANNFKVTLGGNRVLDNPTNIVEGQSGSIFITQDGTGSRTLSYGSYWDFPAGITPTLSTAANSIDRLDYIVRTTTSIHAVLSKDVK